MQHINLQHGLFANLNGKHFNGSSKEKKLVMKHFWEKLILRKNDPLVSKILSIKMFFSITNILW